MSVELIRQTLAPEGAPNINGIRAGAKLSEALLLNIFQGLIETNGRGITDKFASEAEISENAQIFVNRILPAKVQPRELGAAKNGGSFSKESHYSQTVTVGIEALTVVDDPIIIPRASQDLINVDLLATQIDLYTKRLNTIINGMTAASKIFGTWKAEVDNKGFNAQDISSTDIANKDVLVRFMECNDLLDLGDSDNGIDVFPEETRIAVFKAGSRAILKAAGVLTLGGANYAYEILKAKGISEGDKANVADNGYIGDIDGVPCHTISGESLQHASRFLGLPEKELAAGTFFGYVSSSYANARGVSTVDQIKIVDTRGGQGIELQPFTKMGAISWYPKGNVLVYKGNANKTGVYKALATLFSSSLSSIAFKLKGEGSRFFPVGSIAATAGTGFTLTATAKDDANQDHVVAAVYYVGDAAVETVEAYAAGYAAATYKGAVTVGSATAETHLTSNKYANCLVISDDGSCAVICKKA